MSLDHPDKTRCAVIDIGSNSVRLVIFSVSDAAMIPGFNEKVMAGLGRGLAETGRLSVEGRSLALAALRRFRSILDGLGVTRVKAVATAAVRVAEDGESFAREAAIEVGVPLSILSGQDEGRISALGVEAGFHRPEGLVADLGGSSLELEWVGNGGGRSGETHMLGPLALAGVIDQSPRDIRKVVRKVLSASASTAMGAPRIYAVGGAWRAFAKVAIEQSKYPLRVLHGFEMTPKQVRQALDAVFSLRGDPKLSDIAGRRAAQLHLTGIVLDELVNQAKAGGVTISSYGLREGVMTQLVDGLRGDSLADGVAAFARLNAWQVQFSEVLFDFTRPLFETAPPVIGTWDQENRLHRAACLLADASGHFHPDHRAEMAFEQALYAPYAGIDHGERLFLAVACGERYTRKFSVPAQYKPLLSTEQFERARQLGQAMRLGAVFSGRSAEVLRRGQLERSGNRLTLRLPNEHSAMFSETVERRLGQAADALGLKPGVSLY